MFFIRQFILLAFGFIIDLISSASSYSAFDCSHQKWEVTYNDTEFMTQKFQKWIYAWENICDSRVHYQFPAPPSGMGASIIEVVKHLVTSIERNTIYRPDESNLPLKPPGVWTWADPDKSRCTLNIRSIDCFTQPLSVCRHNESAVEHLKEQLTLDLKGFSAQPIDACTMAALAQKPLQWVASQFIAYMLRPGESIKDELQRRKVQVFGTVSEQSTTKRMSTIGVHIRGGAPDGTRKVLGVDHYMKYVDQIADSLAHTDRPVGLVFFCSHIQEENVISAEHMQSKYNRTFKFVVLPHTLIGHGEVEWYVQHERYNMTGAIGGERKAPTRLQLAVDFYSDIHILAKTDYFIGSSSNIYGLVAGMRIANGKHIYRNQTCVIDSMIVNDSFEMHCEGSAYTKKEWRAYHSKGAFNNINDSLNFISYN